MKKTIAAIILCLSLHQIGYSQRPDFYDTLSIKPSYARTIVGISIGAGIPLSSYGAQHYNGSSSEYYPGYAEIGSYFALNLEGMLTPHLCVALLIAGSSNPINTTNYARDYAFQAVTNGNFGFGSINITASGNYSVGEYFFGLGPTIYPKPGQMLQFIFSVGLVYCTIPQLSFSNASGASENPQQSTNAFGANLTIRYSIKIYKSIHATFSCAYTGSASGNGPFGNTFISLIEPASGISFNF